MSRIALSRGPDAGLVARSAGAGARILVLALILATVGAAFRATAVASLGGFLGWCDASGLALDATVAVVVALFVIAVGGAFRGPAARVVRTILLAAFWLTLVLAYENVRVLGAWPRPQSLNVALDSTFLGALLAGRTLELVLLLGAAIVVDVVVAKVPAVRGRLVSGSWAVLVVLVAVSAAVVAGAQPRGYCAAWRTGHFFSFETLGLGSGTISAAAVAPDPDAFAVDLEAEAWLDLPLKTNGGGTPNVLLVMLEGVGGAFLPSVARQHGVQSHLQLRHIDEATRQAALFSTVVYHQRQTHRGQYALLCGDLPSFGALARFDVPESWPHECLPRILQRLGWRTTYFQPAPLAYMGKDRALPIAGFETVLGDEIFASAPWRGPWGVDDRQFFDKAREVILEDRAKGGQSLVALLTVGTHHPYVLPPRAGESVPLGASAFERSFLYLDRAFGDFWSWLEREGVFRDTLVVVTADESAGLQEGGDLARELSQTLGMAFVRGPGIPPRIVADPFGQNELAIAILDAIGQGQAGAESGLGGRSLWRAPARRALYFGNVHLGHTGRLGPDGHLTVCEAAGCNHWGIDPRRWFDPPRPSIRTDDRAAEEAIAAVVRHANRGLEQIRGQVELLAPGPQTLPAVGGRWLAGGGWLWIEPQQHARLVVDLRTTGRSGWVHPRIKLADGREALLEPPIELPSLGPGSTVRLVATAGLATGSTGSAVGASIKVDRLIPGDLQLQVDEASMEAVRGPANSGITIVELDVRRPGEPPATSYGLGDLGPSQIDPCLRLDQGTLRGTCRSGLLVEGPTFYAPAGSRVVARAEVEGAGEATLLVGSRRAGVAALTSGSVHVVPGSPVSLVIEGRLAAQFSELELGLVWDSRGANEAVVTLSAWELRVEPP